MDLHITRKHIADIMNSEDDNSHAIAHYIATGLDLFERAVLALEAIALATASTGSAVVRDIESMEALRAETEKIMSGDITQAKIVLDSFKQT